jgi:4-hydroxy-4-methyl-2-oxoglutarate aldolase
VSSKTSQELSGPAGHGASQRDLDLFERVRGELYTAVISDSLDELGLPDQVMREFIRPLAPESTLVGWARTILCMDLHYVPEDPYRTEIEAVDSIEPGEVVVVATGCSKRNAPWGELLSTAAVARGARGCVTDGLVRDTRKILQMGFPLFCAGVKPVDSKGRGIVVNYNFPVDCGGVMVNPGDLVVADCDGVVVIPRAVVDETLQAAADKVNRENDSREDLRKGAFLRDVYARYGVL